MTAERLPVGSAVRVFFNGSAYAGTVVGIAKPVARGVFFGAPRRVVRFTTGSGKTREVLLLVESLERELASPTLSPRERGAAREKRFRGGM